MSDEAVQAGDVGSKRAGKRTLVALIILLVAVAVFGVAAVYAGGIDYVTGLLSPASTQQAATTPTQGSQNEPAAAAAAALPAGMDDELATRMYVQQLQSAENLKLLAEGEFATFAITKVAKQKSDALVNVTATLKDKTTAPGVMRFVLREGKWYFFAITGLREGTTGGLADATNDADSLEPASDTKSQLAALGVKTVDEDIKSTVAQQQADNQAVIADIMDGRIAKIEMGTPTAGAGTVSIPVTLSGASGSPTKGTIVLVQKDIDGKTRTFLTTFKQG